MSEESVPINLADVPENMLWKELSLRHRTIVLVVMDDDLHGAPDESTESKDVWWSGGHTNALGLLTWAREDLLHRIRKEGTEAEDGS